jgi:hypothetical protein
MPPPNQQTSHGSFHSPTINKCRTFLRYGLVAIMGITILIGMVLLLSGKVDKAGNAHVNQATGSTNGVPPDSRAGVDVASGQVLSLRKAARLAGCVLRLRLKDEGHGHLSWDAASPDYNTNPPTSGDHVEAPYQQADGAYSAMPPEIATVHSLEHGRLEIQYKPSLPEHDQLDLVGLYDTMYAAALLFPNDQMHYAVAATTWTNLLGCAEYHGAVTLDAIRDFGRATWGRYGGQPVNAIDLYGPTPVDASRVSP